MEKPKGMSYRRNAIFSVYKGEKHLVTGTANECATELGVRPEYITWMTTPTGKKRLYARRNPEEATVADIIDFEEVN